MSASVGLVPFDRATTDLSKLDLSFTSDRCFGVTKGSLGEPRLGLSACDSSYAGDYNSAIGDRFSEFSDAWVAILGSVAIGVMATSYDEWNRRLTVVHFYVDRPHRRQGVGSILMAQALETGQRRRAVTAWAEASNVNYPAILAYQALGFEICGFDQSLYRGTRHGDQFALFLSRAI